MFNHPGATVAASVLALIVAALIWTVGRQRWPRTTLVLVLGGAGGLVGTTLGQLLHRGMNALYGWVGQWSGDLFGIGAGIVAVVSGIWFALVVAFDAHHRTVREKTLASAAVAPWAVAFVPGVVGVVLGYIVSAATALVGTGGYLLFHGHL
jgi:hypothetical protein